MDKEAMQGLVNTGATLAGDAEAKLAAAYDAIMATVDIPRKAFRLGMLGYLESQQIEAAIRSAAGKVAESAGLYYGFHIRATEIAISHGVDVPAPRDGGGGR